MTAVPVALLQAAQLIVGQGGGGPPSIQAALDRARPGDTVRVSPGVYHEHLLITKPVVLLGEPGAVVNGDGDGVVLRIGARATVRGLTLRGSGERLNQEDGGIIAAGADSLVIEGNRLEDVLFGIYLKQCHHAVIRGNTILGKPLVRAFRGDGVRLWYSHGGRVFDNVVRHTRDVVVWFSDSALVSGNEITDGRYGLHYMYSRHNRFERNVFLRNDVGAFIMYSQDIVFQDNVFAEAHGRFGRGLGFKDSDDVRAVRNILVKNAVGISLDNSPSTVKGRNEFSGNVVAFNDVGVVLLPSVRANEFRDNTFQDNVQPVSVTGGGTALANAWQGNYWSEYVGFDRDGDGRGDSPFIFERLSDDLLAKHEELRLYNLSPAANALNTVSHVLPLLQPAPIVIDSTPRVAMPPVPDIRPATATGGRRELPAALGFLGVALVAGLLVPRWRRPFRSRR